ncbi:MAG: hypothetical protein QOE93_883 [Actinomycetota bacterium]|jgi:hypothetical protein|nr:hypothetical protein [Actinomycetota bacterium]
MFDALAEAIGELDIPVDGPALVQVLALLDQLNARIAEAVGEFDAHELWDIDGAVSIDRHRFEATGGPPADAKATVQKSGI